MQLIETGYNHAIQLELAFPLALQNQPVKGAVKNLKKVKISIQDN